MLLYCMTEAEPDLEIRGLPPGVHEAEVESLEESGVRCFYSRVEDFATSAESLRTDALRFHAVLRAILERGTIVPFRFPTLLKTDDEIRELLASQAPEYLQNLRQLRGKVQMEVRIRPRSMLSEPQSGKEYMDDGLDERLAVTAHAGAVFAAASELVADWQVRQEARSLRCYALVPREKVAVFEERIRALSPIKGASIVVSGPWPASEFLHVQNP